MLNKITVAKYNEILESENPFFEEYSFGEYLKSILEHGFLRIKLNKGNDIKNNIRFSNCEFDIGLTLNDFSFNDSENIFVECVFNKNVIIRNMKFSGLHIENTVFNKNIIIYNSIFDDGIYFNDVIINGEFNFDQSSRQKNIVINEARFICDFNGKLSFNNVTFKYVNFTRSVFGDRTIVFNHCSFDKLAIFRNLHLSSNIVFNNIDLTNCSFLNSNFEEVKFSTPSIVIEQHIDNVFCNDNLDENVKSLEGLGIYNKEEIIKEVNESNLADEYRSFEKNLDRNKNFDLAGRFHKKYFDIKTKYEKKKINKFILKLYKWISNYGESFSKPLFYFCVLIFAFSIIYLLSGLEYKDGAIIYYFKCDNIYKFYNDIALSFVYSVINSFPVKRDIDLIQAANGFTIFLTVLQTIIQSILITLFIIALRRKFKR